MRSKAVISTKPQKSYEKCDQQRGCSRVAEGNTCALVSAAWALSMLDLAAPAARPVVRLLGGMPSALRFALEHPLAHIKDVGITSSAVCVGINPIVTLQK